MSDPALRQERVAGRLRRAASHRYRQQLTLGTSFISRIGAAWSGVRIGRGCIFQGTTRFHRSVRGVIEIGEGCMFRSVGWSNPVGADRPCTVSTLQEGARVLIGRNCGFSATVIAAAEEIVIGDNVLCGSNVTITDSDWHDSAHEPSLQPRSDCSGTNRERRIPRPRGDCLEGRDDRQGLSCRGRERGNQVPSTDVCRGGVAGADRPVSWGPTPRHLRRGLCYCSARHGIGIDSLECGDVPRPS